MNTIDDNLKLKNKLYIDAYNTGKIIQARSSYHECLIWLDDYSPNFNNSLLEFRIKPVKN